MGRPSKKKKQPTDLTTVGGRIKAARVAKDLTQAKLASAADLTPGHIHVLETNGSEPSDATLGRIARVVGRSVKWLRDGSNGNGAKS
jgi:transcriptional regulator with XRE-family HTH domain